MTGQVNVEGNEIANPLAKKSALTAFMKNSMSPSRAQKWEKIKRAQLRRIFPG